MAQVEQAFDETLGSSSNPWTDEDYEGSSLTVTYGKEHFQPCRFQGCDVGPFEITVRIRAGETPMMAKRRAMAVLEEMAAEEYRTKIPRFIERVRETESSV